MSGLLVLAGVNAGSAVLATLAFRLGSYWLPIMAGGVSYVLFRRRYGPVPIRAAAARASDSDESTTAG